MTTYVYHYAFEDGGRGDSPWLNAIEGDHAMRSFLAERLEWLPAPYRVRQVDALMKELAERGSLEVRMEALAEELVNDGDINWEEDTQDLDTAAELRVTQLAIPDSRPSQNPGTISDLKRRLMS